MYNTIKQVQRLFFSTLLLLMAIEVKAIGFVDLKDHTFQQLFSKSNWSLDVAALELKPSFGGQNFGYSSFSNYSGSDLNGNVITTPNTQNRISNVVPKWSWGLDLGLKYFLQPNQSVQVSWYHLSSGVDRFLPQGTLFAGSLAGLYAGQIQIDTQWNALNIELGQGFNLTDDTSLIIHGGLGFVKINNQIQAYPQLTANGPSIFNTSDRLSYSGFGPRLLGELAYQSLYGPHLYMDIGGGLLVGPAKQSREGFVDLPSQFSGITLYSGSNYSQSAPSIVIPDIEAKLGARYAFHLGHSSLDLDVGYWWISYVNALVSYSGVGIISGSAGVGNTANFDLNGLYLGLHWRGENASY